MVMVCIVGLQDLFFFFSVYTSASTQHPSLRQEQRLFMMKQMSNRSMVQVQLIQLKVRGGESSGLLCMCIECVSQSCMCLTFHVVKVISGDQSERG